MKKKLLVSILAIMMIATFSLSACGGGGSSTGGDTPAAGGDAPAAGGSGEPVTLTVTYFGPDVIPPSRGLTYTAKRVEELSGGSLKFDLHLGGNLVAWADQITATSAGTVDIAAVDMGNISPVFDLNKIFTRPTDTMLPDRKTMADIYKKLMHEIPEINQELIDVAGIRWITLGNNGSYALHLADDITSAEPSIVNNKVIDVMGDMAGFIAKHGASTVSLDPSDYYIDLEKGTINGQFNLWGSVLGFKVYEVTKSHVIFGPELPDHPYNGGGLWQPGFGYVINNATWESLSKEHQDILVEAFDDGFEEWLALDVPDEDTVWKEVNDRGHTIKYTDEATFAKWAEPVKAINDAWIKECEDKGLPAQKAFDMLQDEISKAMANGFPDDRANIRPIMSE